MSSPLTTAALDETRQEKGGFTLRGPLRCYIYCEVFKLEGGVARGGAGRIDYEAKRGILLFLFLFPGWTVGTDARTHGWMDGWNG